MSVAQNLLAFNQQFSYKPCEPAQTITFLFANRHKTIQFHDNALILITILDFFANQRFIKT